MADVMHPAAQQFRESLRGLASSVTIISTQRRCTRYGMVATAVMPVSMEPPSLVVAINTSTSIHDPLSERGAFAVNILSEWDERVARGFSKLSGESRFAYGPWGTHPVGTSLVDDIPYLANAQATIFCRLRDMHRFGSHTLFIGTVEDIRQGNDRAPLLYCDGTYGSFDSTPIELWDQKSA